MTLSTVATNVDGDNVVLEVVEEQQGKECLVRKPVWLENLLEDHCLGERLHVPEWEHEDGHRHKHGWRGHDLVHSPHAPVRITDYFVHYGPGTDIPLATTTTERGGAGTVLTGIVEFTAAAESHAGYCHGGSMCSVMDDVVGWVAFCVTGCVRPWTGFTVQVNTALSKPVYVHSTLLIQAEIVRIERRKVFVKARLYDPGNGEAVHATCEGMVVLNKGIVPDAV
jgi:acyl-coenzyme A thioesterase PaaI-like protein